MGKNKAQTISGLAEQTASRITGSVEGWKSYLTTASRLYKYGYDDQLLIYAQRPDATACASMETWNEAMRRWVKPRSRGIALIRKIGGRPRLEYVFDVSDTRPVAGAREPWLWQMQEEYHAPVLDALEAKYGETQGMDFGGRLMVLAARAVKETCREHLNDLRYDLDGSLLEGLDDLNLEVRFRDTLTASVQYTLLSRCGIDPSLYLEDDDLRGITEFSTPAALHHLGDAASALSGGLLTEIGRAIRAEERENLKNPLAKREDIGYTKDSKFSTLNRESDERSIENERAEIQTGGGLPDSRPDAGGRGGGNAAGPVRDAAGDISSRTPPRDVHLDAVDREAPAAPAGNRPTGAGAGRPDAAAVDGTKRRERGTESLRPDEVGTEGERPESGGGGRRPDGNRLQLNTEEVGTAGEEPAVFAPENGQATLFPTVEEQIENITQAEEGHSRGRGPASAFPVPAVPDAVIDRILTAGGNGPHSIERIIAFFQKGKTGSALSSFLKQEYGTGGKGLSVGGKEYAVWSDSEGLRLAPGRSANVPGYTSLSWEKAAARVYLLLNSGRYAAQEKLDGAAENERRELVDKLWNLCHDMSEEAKKQGLLPHISELYKGNGHPESTEKIAACLADRESRLEITEDMARFAAAYEAAHGLLRFRPAYSPQDVLKQLADLSREPVRFPAAVPDFAPARPSFVTEDEIDRLLAGGSGVEEGKLRIYSYFMQGHDSKERAAFLKNEYGTGGHCYTGYNELHDSKGIKLTRADEVSGFSGYDTASLSWNQAQKRIGELIDAGKYLTPEEEAFLPDYEKRTLAREIKSFFAYDPNAPKEESPQNPDLLPYLPPPGEAGELRDSMAAVLEAVPAGYFRRPVMEKALADMTDYCAGRYSLFTPLPPDKLEEKRWKKDAAKQRPVQKEGPEPAGDLAAAARRLAKARKSPENMRETMDGQLSFDFSGNRVAEPARAGQEEKSPVELYREAVGPLTEWARQSDFYGYLRDRDTHYDSAKEVLADELERYMEGLAAEQPALYQAFRSLPNFGEWLVEDILERTYQDYITDSRDALDRYAGNPDAPEWAQKPEPESPPEPEPPTADNSEAKTGEADTTIPPVRNAKPEPTRAGAPEAPKSPQPEPETSKKRPGRTLPERNYRAFVGLFRDIASGKYTAMKLQAGKSFMPLHVETIGENTISVAHYYRQNGDSMADPEITFRIDFTKQTLEPLTYQQDGLGLYQQVYPEPGKWVPKLRADLNRFANQWFANIREQEYLPERAVMYEDDNRVEVSFDGKEPVFPPEEPAPAEDAGASAPDKALSAKNPDAVVMHEAVRIAARLMQDEAYLNARLSNDDQNARIECEAAIKRAVLAMLPEDPELYEAYFSHPEAAQRIQNYLFKHTYSDIKEKYGVVGDPDVPPEQWGQAAPEAPEPNLTPNVEAYLSLKAAHPGKLACVQVDGRYLLYGKDAEAAASALGTKLLTRDIPGLGETLVTGGGTWQVMLKRLLEHGHSVVIAGPEEQGGPDAPYGIIKERDIADFIPLGMELTIDGRQMKIDNVDYQTGTVSLLDMELKGVYPIFREESVPFVRSYVEEAQEKELEGLARESAPLPAPPVEESPEWTEIEGGKLRSIVIDLTPKHAEPEAQRRNFHIADDNLGVGGQKTKYQQNIAAIRILKQLEAENRLATPEEQETLSRYAGWGGIPQAFDSNNEKWKKEYAELKGLLSPEEYQSAEASVLNAHYTTPTVIKAVYQAVENMSLKPGNILEPAMGVGNFFGLVPEAFAKSKLYGVELDSITGRIARQLYQNADITVDGFENTSFPDDFFDLAVGNVPFGEYKVNDRCYDKQNLLIHDYFFAKTLDKVRPGGIVAFVTSKGTLDKKNSKVRQALAQKADLLGAIRLPNNAFKANASTDVTADILFLQNRGSAFRPGLGVSPNSKMEHTQPQGCMCEMWKGYPFQGS